MRFPVVPSMCFILFGWMLLAVPAIAAQDEPDPEPASEPVELVTEPITAEELARKLFPPPSAEVRTRGIELVPSQALPSRVGMLIQFGLDSSEIAATSQEALSEVGRMLQIEALRERRLAIVGHTDASGGAAYNLKLSHDRARAVAAYLIKRHGIASNRLETDGRGEAELLPNRSPRDPVHRRVEFSATP